MRIWKWTLAELTTCCGLICRKIARDNAKQKIWALEGYALRDRLAA